MVETKLYAASETAQIFNLIALILDNGNDAKESRQPGCCSYGKERGALERKGHCGYLLVDDNKNITLHNSLRFFLHLAPPSKPKQTRLSQE